MKVWILLEIDGPHYWIKDVYGSYEKASEDLIMISEEYDTDSVLRKYEHKKTKEKYLIFEYEVK